MTDADPRDVVIGVVARRAGIRPEQVSPHARLLQDLHIDGDDAVDTVLEIAKKCSVDVSGFDSSAHFRSEPSLLSLLPFLPSQKRDQIDQKRPLTVGELIEAARQRKLITTQRG